MAGKTKSSRKSSHTHASSSSSYEPAEAQVIWAPPTSFLFVVNGVTLNDDRHNGGTLPRVDEHGRWLPPISPAGFGEQNPGTVYRWNGGEISVAAGYEWDEGYGCAPSGDTLEIYRATTMFYSNPFHQFLVAKDDATKRELATDECPEDRWLTLQFHHEDTLSVLDYAADPDLAGHEASFIRSLGLTSYENQEPDAPKAGGLAGNLAMLIGLVAFSCKRRDLTQVLIDDRAWRGHRWRGHNRSSGRKNERGMVISVYLDPDNEEGSSAATLQNLEWSSGSLLR